MSLTEKTNLWSHIFMGAHPVFGYLSTYLARRGMKVMWLCETLSHPDFGVLENPFYWVGSDPPAWPFDWMHNRISGVNWQGETKREVKPLHGVWLKGDTLMAQMWSDARTAGVTCVLGDVSPQMTQKSVLFEGDTHVAESIFRVTEPLHLARDLGDLKQEKAIQNPGVLTVQESQGHVNVQYGYAPSFCVSLSLDHARFLQHSASQLPVWLRDESAGFGVVPFQAIPLPGHLIWNAQLLLVGRYLTQLWGRSEPGTLNPDKTLVMGYQKNLREQSDQKLRKISASFAF